MLATSMVKASKVNKLLLRGVSVALTTFGYDTMIGYTIEMLLVKAPKRENICARDCVACGLIKSHVVSLIYMQSYMLSRILSYIRLAST
jgi:hypothetical protein